jgi:hypothetical protein
LGYTNGRRPEINIDQFFRISYLQAQWDDEKNVPELLRISYLQAQWDDEKNVPELYDAPAMQYKLRPEDMANVTTNPAMDAYFGHGPNGFLNMTQRPGFPFL